MKTAPKPSFMLVAAREWRWLRRDLVAKILILGVPIFAFVFLTLAFIHPVLRGMELVVVDKDRSEASNAFVEEMSAAAYLNTTERADDLSTAMRAIRSGEAAAAVYIPPDFEHDLKSGRRPQIVGLYNQQYLTVAAAASSGLGDSLAAAAQSAAARTAPQVSATGSLVPEAITLVNPTRNYVQYVLRTLLPFALHIVVALAAGYSVGSELQRRSARIWLKCAGGNPIVALCGKLAPLFGIFLALSCAQPLIIEGIFGLSFKGDAAIVVASQALLIIAYLAIGALFQLIARDVPTGLGMTSLTILPAFAFAGVAFPVMSMGVFARIWGALLPLRWYMAVLIGQAARGLPVRHAAHSFAALAALTVLYALLALVLLRAVAPSLIRKPLKPQPRRPALAPRGVVGAFVGEWNRVLGTSAPLKTMIIVPLLFAALFPQPFTPQILRKVPIAVVDNDMSELSRSVLQTLDASAGVTVKVRAATLAEAHASVERGETFAIVGIPPGMERDVLKGVAVHIPIYADGAYLFIFRTTAPSIAGAIEVASAELATRGARSDGSLSMAAVAAASPAEVLLEPLYNPVGGFGDYIVPGVFALAVQQSLLISVASLTAIAMAQGVRGTWSSVLGRGVAHVTIYMPTLVFFLFISPRLYGFSTLGDPVQQFALALTYLFAISFMGQAAGAWFKRPENVAIVFLGTSVPQFFLSGIVWPFQEIPGWVDFIGRLFPSVDAMDGAVRMVQLGADLWDVARDWGGLWILALLYFTLAVISTSYVKRVRANA
jgi:ABC-2 type transport system permease protein